VIQHSGATRLYSFACTLAPKLSAITDTFFGEITAQCTRIERQCQCILQIPPIGNKWTYPRLLECMHRQVSVILDLCGNGPFGE
jgi:hypothetical protein